MALTIQQQQLPVAAANTQQMPAAAGAAPNGSSDGTGEPTIMLQLPDGTKVSIRLADAVQYGIVDIDPAGKAILTPQGSNALAVYMQQNAAKATTTTPREPAPKAEPAKQGEPSTSPAAVVAAAPVEPVNSPHAAIIGHRNIGANTQTLGSDGKPVEKTPSQVMGKIASVAFMTRGLMRIAIGPGLPGWQSAFFAVNGVNNNIAGGKMMPDWWKKGPIADILMFAVVGGMTNDSIKALPPGINHFQRALAQNQAKHGANVGSIVRALFDRVPKDSPAPAAPVSAAVSQAAAGAAPTTAAAANAASTAAHAASQVPTPASFLGRFSGILTPLLNIGVALSSLASIVGLSEYTAKNGTKGLISTTTGRDAVIGALSGAFVLGGAFIPASPISIFSDALGNALWMLQLVNEKGWLDAVLGADKDAPSAT